MISLKIYLLLDAKLTYFPICFNVFSNIFFKLFVLVIPGVIICNIPGKYCNFLRICECFNYRKNCNFELIKPVT